MTDDIVTRLRFEDKQSSAFGERWGCPVEITIYREAADEIERLRDDMKELLQITKMFADEGECRGYDEQWGYCTHSHCDWHDAEHLWESFCMRRGI